VFRLSSSSKARRVSGTLDNRSQNSGGYCQVSGSSLDASILILFAGALMKGSFCGLFRG
jgi:hypothetical protein